MIEHYESVSNLSPEGAHLTEPILGGGKGTHWGVTKGGTKAAARDLDSLKCSNRPLQCEPDLPTRCPMIILSSAAAFGFVGLVSIIRDRHVAAFHNFIWCLVLLFLHFFFPQFPQ